MRPRFAGQPQIDSYGDGGFTLASQRFEGSILLTPRGIYPWTVGILTEAYDSSFNPVMEAKEECDFLLIGRGETFAMLPKSVAGFLAKAGFRPDLMSTGAACRTYNVLLAEGRRVAAALIAI